MFNNLCIDLEEYFTLNKKKNTFTVLTKNVKPKLQNMIISNYKTFYTSELKPKMKDVQYYVILSSIHWMQRQLFIKTLQGWYYV